MERLTGRRSGRSYIVGCPDFALPKIAGLIIQQTVDRLAAIEDILGDEYNLEHLREMVDNNSWMSPVCVGCPGKTEDGHRTEKCGYPDDMALCEERQKRLFELVDADREGRCVVLPCKVGDTLYDIYEAMENGTGEIRELKVTDIHIHLDKRSKEWLIVGGYYFSLSDFGKTVFLTRAEAEAALRREQDVAT